MENEIAACVEELAGVRGLGVPKETVQRELEALVKLDHVPPVVAKEELLRRYREAPARSAGPARSEPVDLRLREVREGATSVRIVARVLTSERREVARKSGGGKAVVLSGLLSDGTATLRFSWWDPPAVELERGSVLRVANPRVRNWKGRLDLSFGWSSQVEVASDAELLPLRDEELLDRSVRDLRPGDEGVRLRTTVLFVEDRTVKVGERERAVRSGVMSDATGMIPFTAWTDLPLEQDTHVEVRGAHLRTFRGTAELVLDERTRVERSAEEGRALHGTEMAALPVEIASLEAGGAPGPTLVDGIVVEVRSPSGLVQRCPQCSRSLAKGLCRTHGAQKGEVDLRARLVVDDGTGVLTAQMSRGPVEGLLGLDLAGAVELAREKLDASAVEERLKERVLGRRLRLLGRPVPGTWGLTLFVDRSLPMGRPSPPMPPRASPTIAPLPSEGP
ncbi:MAG: hypothetical protein KGJ23_04665 [Euryarchaeota archaeon]|nr:hypothetical protein [Euryarchaeota archaeon]MDE1835891.1 hypothetical protein [Euryarchaeota archaeon]MDE1880234.1 hypothetical protein [Euryarchaeota archaeon]MDE2044431.1 hypothetical protein [Thermoplasmata archaeon]